MSVNPLEHENLGCPRSVLLGGCEARGDSESLCTPDKHTEVVAEDFGEDFVRLRDFALATNSVAELALNHRKNTLDVGPPMVVGD
jgi:hypothetical protein